VITMGSVGTSRNLPRVPIFFALEMASTTAMPSVTRPNTAYPQP
jgi:hypothetical protein